MSCAPSDAGIACPCSPRCPPSPLYAVWWVFLATGGAIWPRSRHGPTSSRGTAHRRTGCSAARRGAHRQLL
ncbi:hypothetical protein LV779_17925 [Streptomyces thinghirensis]|nr:hypothetical protein [Streptomyces thinghirensis]